MKRTMALSIILFCLSALVPGLAPAQESGLILNTDQAWPGYTLFSPLMGDTNTYLITNNGTVAHSWPSAYSPGMAAYLTDSGQLLREAMDAEGTVFADTGGVGGRVQLIDPDGTTAWDYRAAGETYHQHHDIKYMPNGHVLMMVWDYLTTEEAIAAGRNPSLLTEGSLWPERIIEVDPTTDEIVWQWQAWDHLIQNYDPTKPNYGQPVDNPQRIDLNFDTVSGEADWIHFNALAYNSDLDQIILSVHNFNEVWIIDHSTTTEEAASSAGGRQGRGGDLLYRWGNPRAYGAGDEGDQVLYGQHDAQWIPTGLAGESDILLFNNGYGRPDGQYSRADQFTLPVNADGSYSMSGSTYGPNWLTWSYRACPAEDLYSPAISGVQRLPNSNTLIAAGVSGQFREVTVAGEVVWQYNNPYGDASNDTGSGFSVFKIRRYDLDYSGIAALGLN